MTNNQLAQFMNLKIKTLLVILASMMVFGACGNKDPHKKGIEAGKATCKCYQLEGQEAISCIEAIEKEYQMYLYDTTFTNAMELQLLDCISDGVADIVK